MRKKELIKIANAKLIGSGTMEVVDNLFSKSYIVHADGKDHKGHKVVKSFIEQLRTAISTIRIEKIEFLSEVDQTITWQRTLSGVHNADMMGIPPTGRKVRWTDMVVSRFENEKIAEEWTVSGLLGQLLLHPPKK